MLCPPCHRSPEVSNFSLTGCPHISATGAGHHVTFCQRLICSSLNALLTLSIRTCTFMSFGTLAECMLCQRRMQLCIGFVARRASNVWQGRACVHSSTQLASLEKRFDFLLQSAPLHLMQPLAMYLQSAQPCQRCLLSSPCLVSGLRFWRCRDRKSLSMSEPDVSL